MNIRVEEIWKRFYCREKKIIALCGISLSSPSGDFVAIVGESGSGKTTLLNVMCGMEKPDSGRVYLGDEEITRMTDDEQARKRRSDIGVIYQFYNLIPELSVGDNVTLPRELDGRAVEEERLRSALDSVGLSGRGGDFPDMLSGGQQQRAAIARAIYQEPSVILADEPTGNLDEKCADEIVGLLKRINKERGTTVIVVTHSGRVAEAADRVITVKDGAIVSDVRNKKKYGASEL